MVSDPNWVLFWIWIKHASLRFQGLITCVFSTSISFTGVLVSSHTSCKCEIKIVASQFQLLFLWACVTDPNNF